ncbi:glycosyltransferase family 4 protein [Jiangella muralis]|uniref:glycosyltransferase family 4 protein n=1 Tax=Jiangella muralis TaxID=702383 RepID=UPI00069D67BD|nr:glycosyltransferase family 4 protein [Jiangella muralis]
MSPDRPRIGYVLKVYPRFSETFVVTEILARETRGTEIQIFSLRPPADSRFHDTLARVSAPVTYVPRIRRPDGLWSVLAAAAAELPRLPEALPELLAADAEDAGQAVDLAVRVRRAGLTHLHAHFGSVATTVARLASLLTGVPYSFTAHAKDIFHESVDPADLRRKLTGAAHAVTVSDWNAAYLADRYGAAAGRVHRVYNGLDLDAFPFQPDAADRPPVVAAVGRLVEKKGFDVLLDACRLLADAGREFRCRVVGTGLLEAELRERSARLGLTGVVEFTGPLPQPQVRAVVRSAAVLAAPCVVGTDGNQDGLPTVLLESMALGTPCVSTDVAGIGEVVRDETTGLLVPQRDPVGLARAVARLLDDTALRTRLATAARGLVEKEFDAVRQARELDELLVTPEPAP